MKTDFYWNDLVFGSRKEFNNLRSIFIAAPRQLSQKRLVQLVKTYLPKGNIVIGIAKEPFVSGFENQPQFRTLQPDDIKTIVEKVNVSSSPHKLYALHYSLNDQKYLFEKLRMQKAVFVNGSWFHSFHTTETYYALINNNIPYDKVSPFADEDEAKEAEGTWLKEMHGLYDAALQPGQHFNEHEMLKAADIVSRFSFDHSHQTGVALGKKEANGEYTLLATSFNKVVPFQTFAWHYGPAREKNFSPPHDLNHYDTIHAEAAMIIHVARNVIDLSGTTFFINLLPCPTCSRMLAETDIAEFVYSTDHSNGYAIAMLEAAGKTVRRIVSSGVI